jgi:hypothetical protein
MTPWPLLLALALASGLCAPALHAATWTVAPGQSLQEALNRAVDGDVIEIAAGQHHGQVGVVLQRRLTLRGVGGRPVLHADGQHAEGKAMLVVRDGDVHIDNIEFRGVRVADGNGAGIRFERGRLQVTRCAFVDNQNGILTGNVATAELTVQDSEFAQAPAGTSLPHLLYVGRIARFTLTGSHFSGGHHGHLVKSRALENRILYNRLDDRPAGQASYELEFPHGGLAWVVGNVLAQSGGTSNATVLAFGAEGSPDGRAQGLVLSHNTFISEGLKPALFVRVHEAKLGVAVPQRVLNNLFVGLGLADVDWGSAAQGNFALPAGVLLTDATGLPRLAADSWLRGRAVEAGMAQGQAVQPMAEFVSPTGTRPLAPRSIWAPGAFQD